MWTNSKTISYNYGSTIGLSYLLPLYFKISGNVTYSKLDRKDQQDGLEDGFNTPEWIYNLNLSNPQLIKNFGFSVNYRWQKAYLWQSALATGTVSAYSTLDAQINYGLFKNKLNIKIGANNLLNQFYYSFLGGPSVGAFYYCTLVYDIL